MRLVYLFCLLTDSRDSFNCRFLSVHLRGPVEVTRALALLIVPELVLWEKNNLTKWLNPLSNTTKNGLNGMVQRYRP
jgi:hypothetical protein